MSIKVKLSCSCPDCYARMEFKEMPELGDVATCPECRTVLEVVSQSPLRVDWFEDDDDNWEDDATPAYRDEYADAYADVDD